MFPILLASSLSFNPFFVFFLNNSNKKVLQRFIIYPWMLLEPYFALAFVSAMLSLGEPSENNNILHMSITYQRKDKSSLKAGKELTKLLNGSLIL